MLKYPSLRFCLIYYSYAFGISTVLLVVIGATAFGKTYHFNTAQMGMAAGVSTTIGSIIGELASGPVSNRIIYLNLKRNHGAVTSEARLTETWPGAFLLPAGVIIQSVCLEYKTHWAGPVLDIGIAAFGLQIVSTNIYAYLADCYKPQNAEISTLLNFGRLSCFSFTLGFYMVSFISPSSSERLPRRTACLRVNSSVLSKGHLRSEPRTEDVQIPGTISVGSMRARPRHHPVAKDKLGKE